MAETKRPTSPTAEEILGLYFPVLDHGFVALVDYLGTDECIERAARVSYGYGTRKQSVTRGLLRYLRRHKHTTPSEMVELKFHCCMPMFIARQWIRHRTASVNEYSGRYSLMPMLFYTPEAEQLQTQSRRNNQGRSGQAVDAQLFAEAQRRWSSDPPREHRRLRLADRKRGRARAGAHRPAAVDVHAVVLEDRPAQPAALPDLARGHARAVGDPGVRARDGRHAQARRAAVVRGVDRLRRVRHARVARRAVRAARAGEASTATAWRRRVARAWIARRWRGTAWPSARSRSCSTKLAPATDGPRLRARRGVARAPPNTSPNASPPPSPAAKSRPE